MKHFKLHTRDIKAYRDKQLKKQKGICPLLGTKIQPGQEALDHNHKTGHCRMVLDRQANALEGKIINALSRFIRNPDDFAGVLERLVEYWKGDYTANPLHPKYLIQEEKELKRLKKLKASVKKAETKQQYTDKIKVVEDNIKDIITLWENK